MDTCLPDTTASVTQTTDLDSTTLSTTTLSDTTTSVSDTMTTSESVLTTASTILTDIPNTTEDPATTIHTQYTIISETTSESSTIPCIFRCPCGLGGGNLTDEMLQEIIAELKSILTVDKTKTSSFIRKHTSAKDDRPSSQVIGAVGSVFIIFTLGSVVLSDVINVIQSKSNHLKRQQTLKRRDTMYLSQ